MCTELGMEWSLSHLAVHLRVNVKEPPRLRNAIFDPKYDSYVRGSRDLRINDENESINPVARKYGKLEHPRQSISLAIAP